MSPVIQSWILNEYHIMTSFDYVVRTEQKRIVQINLKIIHQNYESLTPIVLTIGHIVAMVLDLYEVSPQRTHGSPESQQRLRSHAQHFGKPPTSTQIIESLNLIYVMTPFRKVLNFFNVNPKINRFLINLLKKDRSFIYNYHVFTNPLTTLSVNSGATVDGSNKTIVIWRQEEFEKVLIHELIHYYHLEHGNDLIQLPVNISNNYPHYPKELFTELQTWYLYTIYRHNDSPHIQAILNNERLHSFRNMIKILKHFKVKNFQHFLSQTTDNSKYRLNLCSSTLYYYIYKAILLCYVNPAIENIMIPYPPISWKYVDLILKRTLVSPELRKLINHYLKDHIDDDTSLMMMSD